MKWLLRRISARILLVVASAFGVFWAFETVWGAQRLAGGAGMSTQMKTVCVGRFLIDVPFNAQVTFGSASLGGFNITNYGNESVEEFEVRLVRREVSINAEKTRDGKKNMVSVQKVHHADLKGKIFIFGLNSGYLIENGVKVIYTDVTIEGFAQVNSLTVRFSAKASRPGDAIYLERLLKQVRRLDAGVIPNEPGFCMDGILVRDPITADQRESIVMFAGMPGHEGLDIGMATIAGKTPAPGLIERHKANRTGAYAFLNLMTSTLIEGPRNIDGLEGDEFAFKARERNLSTGYAFNWETQGTEDNVLRPFVSLELQTGISPRARGEPVQSTLSEESLGDLWRRMSSSLRLRPVQQPVADDPDVQLRLALGTLAWAGNTCQQTGWWQCGQANAHLGVFGGEQQFLREGQVVPQALLLPKPTMWQKMRGLQPSFEASTPTNWRLADKRIKGRRAPAAGLAESTPAVSSLDSNSAVASLGRTMRSGERCPASGWWRCMDDQALDNTRWFPGGVILPAASYHLTSGGPRYRVGAGHLIQRQAAWQLMRLAVIDQLAEIAPLHDTSGELPTHEAGLV